MRIDLARIYNRQLIIEFQTRFCKSIKGLVMDEHLVFWSVQLGLHGLSRGLCGGGFEMKIKVFAPVYFDFGFEPLT